VPSEGFEQQGPHSVEIRRRGDGLAGGVFGRHVAGGAENGLAPAPQRRASLHSQAEVEHHHAPARLDHDVRRLQVAVHAVRAMERVEPQQQLRDNLA
jgi:hypothetical protein